MELKEPKRKRRVRLEPKSSLPLVFGSKGELTKFHATLTALGSCIADPTEMEIIYKMGYFGKGSLSRSHPSFGRTSYGAPPIIRNRQWKRREQWISEVQKLSIETFFDEEKNEGEKCKSEDVDSDYDKDENKNEEELNSSNELNESNESNDKIIVSNSSNTINSSTTQEKSSIDIEILDSGANNVQQNGNDGQEEMDVDEVILDSTEDEEICEVSSNNYQNKNIYRNDSFGKDEEILITSECNNEYNKVDSVMQGKVLTLPDSDSDTENYLIDVKPVIKLETFPVRETLHLTFEETFFLMYGLGCLRVIDFDGKYLNITETWDYFCKEQKSFIQKYVVYHYFRSKGWVVKSGLKYGGDFLLYKEGPPFYHSSYLVIIDVLDAVTFKRIENKCTRSMSWNKFFGLERLTEAVNKEVLFAQVLWPSTVPIDTIPSSPDVLSQFTIKEILWRRWKLNQDINTNNEDLYGDDVISEEEGGGGYSS